MSSQTHATVDDLYRVQGKAELVGGEIINMSPTGGLPGYAAGRIWRSLDDYALRVKRGYAIVDNVGFIVNLPHRQSFSPDVAYYIGQLTMKLVKGAPLLAVEVRSENDYGAAAEQRMAEKRDDYFAAGTKVVWDVDLESSESVRVYRADNPSHPTIYRRGDLAEAEPALYLAGR